MAESREAEIVGAFVRLANMLALEHDVVEMLETLTAECTRLLDVSSAGLLLADALGDLHVMAASSPEARQVEHFQVQAHEGPCRECFETGRPVLVPDLARETEHWPTFARGALEAGFASVHALPMRLRSRTLGALGLFGNSVGQLGDDDLELGQALADVASVALVQHTARGDQATIADDLQDALDRRVAIEQAKGILAQRGGTDMARAQAVLKAYAEVEGRSVSDAARLLVSREISAAAVLAAAEEGRGDRT